MLRVLKDYYRIEVDYIENGYFQYNHLYYYIMMCDEQFLSLYSHYDFMIHLLNIKGYRIVKNCFNQIFSQNYVLFCYENETVDIKQYLTISLKNIPNNELFINQIKEGWIQKIDMVRNEICKYSYSFQYDRDLNALMHYYCGLAENGIGVLNEIIKIQKNARLPLSLSLKQKIEPYFYQLLNPSNYTISTRSKHVLYLLKSQIISFDDFVEVIEQSYFHVYELLYLYARAFYCPDFFNCVLSDCISDKMISYYLMEYKEDLEFLKKLRKVLTKFISLPEISWIEQKNMI